MPVTFITFQDGPCANKTVQISTADLTRGYVACGGATYQIEGVSPGVYIGLVQPTGTSGSLQAVAPDVFAGFHDLMRALATTLRPALDRARRNNQVALSALPRIHRVKGR